MLEKIAYNRKLLAIIIYNNYSSSGVEFLTQESAPIQVGVMCHPKGYEITPHLHVPCERAVQNTQEVLFIRKGKLRVDFYDNEQKFLESRTLGASDAILLVSGGHGFAALEDLEMIEAKTGPFVGEKDKVRFERKV